MIINLIQNINANYACISDMYTSANNERLGSPYKGEEPHEGLITGLNECTDFSPTAREPVSDTQLVVIAYRLVAETRKQPK